MSAILKYDPKKIKVTIESIGENGNRLGDKVIQSNLGDGLVTVEPNSDAITYKPGVQGGGAITFNADTAEILTLSYQSNAPDLFELRNRAKRKEQFRVEIVDMNSNILISSNDCYCQTIPSYSRTNEVEDVDVEILMLYPNK